MTEEQYRATQELEREIRDVLVAAMETGDPASEEARHAADLHRQWLCAFWKDGTYSKAAHRGLAEMYVADERFKAYYEAWAPPSSSATPSRLSKATCGPFVACACRRAILHCCP